VNKQVRKMLRISWIYLSARIPEIFHWSVLKVSIEPQDNTGCIQSFAISWRNECKLQPGNVRDPHYATRHNVSTDFWSHGREQFIRSYNMGNQTRQKSPQHMICEYVAHGKFHETRLLLHIATSSTIWQECKDLQVIDV
jgi:hypothetical protein